MFGNNVSDADNDVTTDNSDLLSLVKSNRAGLKTLRDDHLDILSEIRNEEENRRNTGETDNAGVERDIEERISAVTESLQMLEVGVAESGVMLSLSAHFDMLESERSITRMEMRRVKDENDWLREELEDTEKRLEDALSRLACLEEEKKHWEFLEQTRQNEKEANLKKVTPSKIPVGSFRVEEEKAINRALNGQHDSNRQSNDKDRGHSPPPPSKIPKFFKASNYIRVKEKIEKAANEKSEAQKKLRGKSHKLTLTPASSHSLIPMR